MSKDSYTIATGSIRVHLHHGAAFLSYIPEEIFDIHIHINPTAKTYHATISMNFWRGSEEIDIEMPSDIIEELVGLSENKEFMSLTEEEIFPNKAMLDGRDIAISICRDNTKVSFSSNLLEDTLENGILPTAKGEFKTPFDRIAAIGKEYKTAQKG